VSNFIKIGQDRINIGEISNYFISNNELYIVIHLKNTVKITILFPNSQDQTEVKKVIDKCVAGDFTDEKLRKKYLVQ